MKLKRKSTWLKSRGYIHLTKQINILEERGEVLGKVRDKSFVSKHAFFPLLHTNIKVRRYKFGDDAFKRSHSFNGKTHSKLRPLHYATHIDSMIFGYYGEKIQIEYLKELKKHENLSDCVTAYRRIADPEKKDTYKSTIHFAHEVFEEIKKRSDLGCWVLKFDIEKFFSSMNHSLLKKAWAKIIDETTLPIDHYNVFKAATKFSYILKDDLRIRPIANGKKNGFDEKLLSENRKTNINAFFKDPTSFRQFLKEGKLRIYKNEFKDSKGRMIGIPQGLPINATLANLYLLEFDKRVLDTIVNSNLNGYYRRYSDDIIIICDEVNKEFIIDFIGKILSEDSLVNISKEKTEQFNFKKIRNGNDINVLSHLYHDNKLLPGRPLTYLGFEFYGYKTLIKSANLSKFYRRMILAVKSSSKRAVLGSNKGPFKNMALFRRRLYRLYANINLDKKITKRNFKTLGPNRFGYNVYYTERKDKDFRSNYFTYCKRAAKIMNEPRILQQIRRHRVIFNQAMKKHLAKSIEHFG